MPEKTFNEFNSNLFKTQRQALTETFNVQRSICLESSCKDPDTLTRLDIKTIDLLIERSVRTYE